MAGVDLPVQPLRRMLVPTEPFPGLPERLPMMIDMTTGWHFRQEGLGLLMAWAGPDQQHGRVGPGQLVPNNGAAQRDQDANHDSPRAGAAPTSSANAASSVCPPRTADSVPVRRI